ncbi:MAG: hypothetical protein PHS97_06975 [Oscillospiraceae bacterium]|nr:hypothetical protein [Oscillospiraceae bacterium]
MIRIRNLKLSPGEPESQLAALAARALRLPCAQLESLRIEKKSIDARDKSNVRVIYTVDVAVPKESAVLRRVHAANITKATRAHYHVTPAPAPAQRPVIVGFGPAGMFAGLVLALAGWKPIILERGRDAISRQKDVEAFWATGKLDAASNVQFGEGGAGTFSDGKLNTGVKDDRIGWVLAQFHAAGAPESILYDAKPHMGTDVLVGVVQKIRARIESLGGEVRFQTQLTGLSVSDGQLTGIETNCGALACSALILAIGHSARDTYEMLCSRGVSMEPKAFSMGVRIEHKQSLISASQYGEAAQQLPPAAYKLACHLPDGASAYSFCMCPGGYVVAAASEDGRVVTNGMSNQARDGENANAALLVTLPPEVFPDSSVLGGMRWQQDIERAAYLAGGESYRAPAQLVGDFLAGRRSTALGTVTPTYRPGVTLGSICDCLPPIITDTIAQALPALDQKLHGFAAPDAVMTAPETRSSAPVRILRDASMQSPLRGLYPCGEGAGYAGGITSAAVDGMKCAEALLLTGGQPHESV